MSKVNFFVEEAENGHNVIERTYAGLKRDGFVDRVVASYENSEAKASKRAAALGNMKAAADDWVAAKVAKEQWYAASYKDAELGHGRTHGRTFRAKNDFHADALAIEFIEEDPSLGECWMIIPYTYRNWLVHRGAVVIDQELQVEEARSYLRKERKQR